ncbi:hypothetical protein [Planotetraspora phitsanulokensis]|uniref:hypothetical protein n=1 Tax=Planotetraspora phitsanulokensis TaxID=575192 RepID=UPI001EF27F20|nr:hypothetical protein [Planotetraspora phitsanulokensis]
MSSSNADAVTFSDLSRNPRASPNALRVSAEYVSLTAMRAAELDVDLTAQEVIAGWRATARIKADPGTMPRRARLRAATLGR